MTIIIRGFRSDHANPSTELEYFIFRSLITRFSISSL